MLQLLIRGTKRYTITDVEITVDRFESNFCVLCNTFMYVYMAGDTTVTSVSLGASVSRVSIFFQRRKSNRPCSRHHETNFSRRDRAV